MEEASSTFFILLQAMWCLKLTLTN